MLTPTIRITENDVKRLKLLLSTLAPGSRRKGTYVRGEFGELGRAEIVALEDLPPGVITLGSTAEPIDPGTQETMMLT